MKFLTQACFLLAISSTSGAQAQSVQENARVSKQLEKVLRSRVSRPDGKAISLRVVPTNRAGRGEFSRVVVQSAPAKIGDLFLSQVSLDASNAQIDVPYLFSKGKIRTKRATTKLRAVISQNDLTQMLSQGSSTRNMNLKVRFLNGNRMRITGNLNYTLINGPVVGIGQFRQLPGSRVNLDIVSLKLRGVEVPGFVKERFSRRVNPIIKYQDLPFSPKFKTFYLKGDKAFLST